MTRPWMRLLSVRSAVPPHQARPRTGDRWLDTLLLRIEPATEDPVESDESMTDLARSIIVGSRSYRSQSREQADASMATAPADMASASETDVASSAAAGQRGLFGAAGRTSPLENGQDLPRVGIAAVSGSRPIVGRRDNQPTPNMPAMFVRNRGRAWANVPVPLSAAVTTGLWMLFLLDLVFGAWLLAVRVGAASCSGPLCTVATLGDHPLLTLVLAEVCAAALVVSLPITKGLSRAGGPQLAVIALGALSGTAALAGVSALLLAAGLCLVVALAVLLLIVDRL